MRRQLGQAAALVRPLGAGLAVALVAAAALAQGAPGGMAGGADGVGARAELLSPAAINAAIVVLGLGWLSLQARRLLALRAARRRAEADR